MGRNIGASKKFRAPRLTASHSAPFKKGEWPVAENEYERVISLPIFPGMTERDVEDVIAAVQKVIVHFRR